MRLLLQDGAGKFNFREFQDDEIPPYAILSHTWLTVHEGEEPTYEDLKNGSGEGKFGYTKIQFCGEQARRDGLQYFWVDTCCINKANYAELQYAINSMFRWYRNATRCYVYMSDVTNPHLGTNAQFNPQSWDSEFWKGRWFTRGWTLQELLAPRSVEFFDREGSRLGDKISLKQQIQAITGIPALALQGAPLFQFSTEERFSWMDRRQTTLEVDRVYSLLGILNVKIPLFKDTEAATAFKRLREVIDKREICIKDLRLTDPRHDKKRIEDIKGGLIEDSYRWILGNFEFQQWHSAQQSSFLWIKGDPGKGKTMLLCGIINELNKLEIETTRLSYFFCQANDARINSATAVLRGLIYILVDQQPSLTTHIQKKYDYTGKALFEDMNAWIALSEIFIDILQDPSLDNAYLIVDGLDECVIGLSNLLDLIIQTSSKLFRVKWIVSSRNWPEIVERLINTGQNLSLELNAESVSEAVNIFIREKVLGLAQRKKYNITIRDAVLNYLLLNANGTFLWVALVCQDLEKIPKLAILTKLKDFPPGLDALYERMMKQIRVSDYTNLCNRMLASIAILYRPVTLTELIPLIDMPEDMSDDTESLREIIDYCGSFLTVRKDTIYFVHQSAKDYLLTKVFNEIFPFGKEGTHHEIFSRSLKIMSRILRQDIYSLNAPGISIDEIEQPDPDPLTAIRYSCVYWVDHLLDCDYKGNSNNNIADDSPVHKFLCRSFLYWLEALSLMRSLSYSIGMIRKLEDYIQPNGSPDLYEFIHDAKRFALYNRSIIEQAPLQSYYSAVIFAPEKSIVRIKFEKCIPTWIQKKPKVEVYWNALLQTLEGHSGFVNSVAFSPDGKQIVSGSDENIRLWDAITGALIQTFESHFDVINSVAFSPDGKQIVSGSDETIRLWDTITGVSLQTFKGNFLRISSVAFSPDSKQVVSGSDDRTIRLWDAITGVSIQKFDGHSDSVNSVSFSPDGKQVVSGSYDKTIRLWDAITGVSLQTFEGHSESVNSVAFSPDGKQIVSGSHDKTIRLWDALTRISPQTFKGHSDSVISIAFSPDGKQIVSGSHDKTIRLWDAITGVSLQTLKGHSDSVNSVAFSPDGKQVVSGSSDKTIRLWDALTRISPQMFKGHSDSVISIAFSPDGKQIVSGSHDKTIRLWDAITGVSFQTFQGYSDLVNSVAYSEDDKNIVSGSYKSIWLSDTIIGASALSFAEGHSDSVNLVAFSPDGKQIVSCLYDKTIRLWDASTGTSLQTLECHSDLVYSVAFSPDGQKVISNSYDKIVQLWDVVTGESQIFEGHSDWVSSVAFTPYSKALDILLVSSSWVVKNGKRILWLPPEYRASCSAFWNNTLALGHSSGRISVIGFKEESKLT